MADRYVNYDKLLEERHRLGLDEMSKIHKVNAFNQFIDELPKAEVEEVRHALWRENKTEYMLYGCSNCDCRVDYEFNYCPNCGARMDGKKVTG